MPLEESPELDAARARLAPYLGRLVERSAERALWLHADAVALEHLLGVLLEDAEAALFRLVEHAFADAETLAEDVLAISPGILVVGSGSTLPFSPRALEAMRRARGEAAGRHAPEVGGADVLRAAAGELEPAARAALEGAGFAPPQAEAGDGAGAGLPEAAGGHGGAPGEGPVVEEGHLFHHFSQATRRALTRAARAARGAGESAISPAHLVVAVLEVEGELAAAAGLGHRRAALLLRGHTQDPTPPPERALAADAGLLAFLASLPRGADSLDVLEGVLADPESEQAQIFTRQKVTLALLGRARGALRDPD